MTPYRVLRAQYQEAINSSIITIPLDVRVWMRDAIALLQAMDSNLTRISQHSKVQEFAGVGDGEVGDAVIALAGRVEDLERQLEEART